MAKHHWTLILVLFVLACLQYVSLLHSLNGTGTSSSIAPFTNSQFIIFHDKESSVATSIILETLASPEATNIISGSSNNSTHSSNVSPSQCPLIPRGLSGPFDVLLHELPASMESYFSHLSAGGRYEPQNCTSRHRVAVIVPYRDREEHLRVFLFNLHSLLQKQDLDYGIIIVEQQGNGAFNRGMLMNVGASEALKAYDYQCFVFHDVDLLPEDDRNLYSCPSQPRHMSVAIDTFMYRLPYDDIFGGVSAMSVQHFKLVNGFSNLFWGWGGEDDDMSDRLRHKKLYISRYPANIARYKMLKHKKDEANPDRFKFLYTGTKRIDKDGFKSLQYKVVKVKLSKLFTWILVDLPHLSVS